LGAALLGASMTSFAYTPGAGIAGTPHDFSSANGKTVLLWQDSSGKATTYNTGTPWIDPATGQQGTTTLSVGQCSTCHALQQQTDYTTLRWNYTLRPTTYRWSDPSTTSGTPYPTLQADTYKGPSTKCLSCHDGLLAPIDGWFDRNVLNPPGHAVSDGVNLSGMHPVAMPYPINGAQSTYNSVRSGVLVTMSDWVPDPMAINGIRLFNDDGTGNILVGVAAGRTGIECSSCHDVHNGPRVKDQQLVTGLLSGNDRGPGGYICVQCHRM
jgi:hypothetical protein